VAGDERTDTRFRYSLPCGARRGRAPHGADRPAGGVGHAGGENWLPQLKDEDAAVVMRSMIVGQTSEQPMLRRGTVPYVRVCQLRFVGVPEIVGRLR